MTSFFDDSSNSFEKTSKDALFIKVDAVVGEGTNVTTSRRMLTVLADATVS